MKKCVLLSLFLSMGFLLTACSGPVSGADTATELPAEPETLVLSINGTALDVQWEENETVAELLAYVQNENITVNTTRYGGFEQVGSLPQRFSRNDA